MMFLDCPAYLDEERPARCGLPAEVRCRFTMRSTDGPMESVMIRCPAGHHFCGAIESLTWDRTDKHDPGSAAVTPRAGRDSLQGSRDGADGSAVRDFPAEPEPDFSRPNTAPAYYLGHPAALWITVMRPRRRRTASHAWSNQARPTPVPVGHVTPAAAATQKGSPTPAPRTARPTRLLPIDGD